MENNVEGSNREATPSSSTPTRSNVSPAAGARPDVAGVPSPHATLNLRPRRLSESSISTSDQSEEQDGVTFLILGVDHPIRPTDTTVAVEHGRVAKIENLEYSTELKELLLVANSVEKIENLDSNTKLERLELYQNQVHRIENLDKLVNLEVLDLSFNILRKIENLENLKKLKKLFLSSNKLTKMENLGSQTQLELLELGSNRIRTIEGISHMQQLEELWLGKNKITSMALPPLASLRSISIQSNRLTEWHNSLFELSNLEEVYLSQNRLPTPPEEIKRLNKLRVLDLAGNRVTSLKPIEGLLELEELWLNDNGVEDREDIRYVQPLTKLCTIYLERNPVQQNLGPLYRGWIREAVPWIKQVDALLLDSTLNVTAAKEKVRPIMKKP